MEKLTEIAQIARLAAVQTGRLLRDKLLEPRTVSRKGFRDLVTDADVAAQALIKEVVFKHFPEHTFLGEEDESGTLERARKAATPVWIVDPVDGTSNYSRSVPIFSVSIGVAVAGQVEVGLILDPSRDELFEVVRGEGASLNGEPLQVSKVSGLSDALVALDWGHSHQRRDLSLRYLEAYSREVHTVRALGSAALGLAWLAAGRLDAYINLDLKPWDIAAGGLLVEEAGGIVQQLDRSPWTWQVPTITCLATTRLLEQDFLDILDAGIT